MTRCGRWSPWLFAGVLAMLATPARAADPAGDFLQQRDRLVVQRNSVVGVLTGWSALSLVAGAVITADPSWIPSVAPTRTERRAFGIATLCFAAANSVFAISGLAGTAHLRDSLPDMPSILHERRTTSDFFAVNAGLDMIYITAGALFHAHVDSPFLRGFGAGILTQGGFLLGFDTSSSMVYRFGGR